MPYCPYTLSAAPSGRWLAPTLGKPQALVRASGTVNDTVILLEKRGANPRVGRELVTTLRSIGYRAQLREVPAVLLPQPTARLDNTAEAGYQGWGADYVTPADFFVPLVAGDVHLPPGWRLPVQPSVGFAGRPAVDSLTLLDLARRNSTTGRLLSPGERQQSL